MDIIEFRHFTKHFIIVFVKYKCYNHNSQGLVLELLGPTGSGSNEIMGGSYLIVMVGSFV